MLLLLHVIGGLVSSFPNSSVTVARIVFDVPGATRKKCCSFVLHGQVNGFNQARLERDRVAVHSSNGGEKLRDSGRHGSCSHLFASKSEAVVFRLATAELTELQLRDQRLE